MSQISARLRQTSGERKRYLLDYAAQLSAGEQVTLVVPTITSPTNAPVSPAFVIDGITIGPGGLQVIFYASGGVDTHTYEVLFHATTTIGQQLDDVAQFDIADKV